MYVLYLLILIVQKEKEICKLQETCVAQIFNICYCCCDENIVK